MSKHIFLDLPDSENWWDIRMEYVEQLRSDEVMLSFTLGDWADLKQQLGFTEGELVRLADRLDYVVMYLNKEKGELSEGQLKRLELYQDLGFTVDLRTLTSQVEYSKEISCGCA